MKKAKDNYLDSLYPLKPIITNIKEDNTKSFNFDNENLFQEKIDHFQDKITIKW